MIIITLILINNIRGVDTGTGYDNIGNCQYHITCIARCLEYLILELILKCRKGNRVLFLSAVSVSQRVCVKQCKAFV